MTGADLPRVPLATLPTPLLAAPRLSEAVGVEVWIKRDDLTGLLLGGNKARKLEFLCGEALAQGADTLVTGGGPASNHVQLTAAAAARLGLGCVVVCYGDAPAGVMDLAPSPRPSGVMDPAPSPPPSGTTSPPPGLDRPPLGLRLTRRLGAEVIFTGSPDRASVDARLEEVAAKLTADGRHPYVIPRGGASAVGAVGYAVAAAELAGQLADAGVGVGTGATAGVGASAGAGATAGVGGAAVTVLLATGSCGTQAGLIAGAGLSPDVLARIVPVLRDDPFPDPESPRARSAEGGGRTPVTAATPPNDAVRLEVVGVPVSRPPEECTGRIARLATGCAERLGSDRVFTADDVRLLGGYIGPGYGKASPEGDEAALLAARTEALVLDPVFTAKAMAALVVECRRGALTGPVVFLHTGGTPSALAALP